MSYCQEKLKEVKAAAAIAGPCVVEEIQACNNWKDPAYFSCTSGVLLWGQLPTVMQGHLEKVFDTPLGPYQTNKGDVNNRGTILQSCFRYRAPALKGLWEVEALFTGNPDRPVGYVCHHIDVNGPDLLRRAAVIGGQWSGVSLQNDHADRDIVYINRYDWSRMGSPNAGYELMTNLLKPQKKRKETKMSANSELLKIGDEVELKILGLAEAEEGIVGSIARSLRFRDDEGTNGVNDEEDDYYSSESGSESGSEHDEWEEFDEEEETEEEEEEEEEEESEDEDEEDEEDEAEDSEFYDSWDEEWPHRMTKKQKAAEAREEYKDGLIQNRLMLVDEEGFPQLVQTLREGFKLDSKNYLFRDNKKHHWFPATATKLARDPSAISDAFGVNLGVCDKDKSYELGWLAFKEGKLIGFVYDGAYCDLSGTSFQCGDTQVDVPRPPESETDEEIIEFMKLNESEAQASRAPLGGSPLMAEVPRPFESETKVELDESMKPKESEAQTPCVPPGGSPMKVCFNSSKLVGAMRICYVCGRGAHFCDPDPLAQGCPNPRKRKRGVSQFEDDLTDFMEMKESEAQTSRAPPGGSAINVCFNSSLVGSLRVCFSCGNGSHLCHLGNPALGCPNPLEKKRGGFPSGFQFGHRAVRHCEHCHKDGHTKDHCFKLYPELRSCDHCHKDGHTRDRCFVLHRELRAQIPQLRKTVQSTPVMAAIGPAYPTPQKQKMVQSTPMMAAIGRAHPIPQKRKMVQSMPMMAAIGPAYPTPQKQKMVQSTPMMAAIGRAYPILQKRKMVQSMPMMAAISPAYPIPQKRKTVQSTPVMAAIGPAYPTPQKQKMVQSTPMMAAIGRAHLIPQKRKMAQSTPMMAAIGPAYEIPQ